MGQADGGNQTIKTVRGSEPFEVFYRREYDGAVRLAYVLSGSRWGAEDLAQDAFMDAHRRWSDIGSYESPEGWVRRAIANRSISAYRKRLAEGRAILKMMAGVRHPIQELDMATEEVWEAVRRLPRRQAQVVALTYLEELSLDEVGAMLEISVPTVGTHLQRARRTLGRSLNETVEMRT